MKSKKEIVNISNETKNFNVEITLEKRPYAIYNGNKYEALIPGEVLKHNAIKNPMPLPNKMYGFIIDDYILLRSSGNYKILNPGYQAFKVESKKKNLITTIIGGAILLIVLIVGIIFAAKG